MGINWPDKEAYKPGWIYTSPEIARIDTKNQTIDACKKAVAEGLDEREVFDIIHDLLDDEPGHPHNYHDTCNCKDCSKSRAIIARLSTAEEDDNNGVKYA